MVLAGLRDRGHPIVVAWRPLAAHGLSCETCGAGIQILAAVPEDPRGTDFEVYDGLCPGGQELFTAWRAAKDAWLELMREESRRRFITDEQLRADGASFEHRARALMSLPQKDFEAWLELPPGPRHAQLLALEAGLRPGSRAGDPLPLCAFPGCQETVPEAKYRYCSARHQKADYRRRNAPTLMSTE